MDILESDVTEDRNKYSNNTGILYMTFIIITGIFLLWIIIVILTKEDPIKILKEMNNLAAQTPAISDI